jgi:thiamine kinase-like enzyme
VARLVVHKDIRLKNMLWNVENQRVMLIDFETSTVFQRKRKLELSHVLDKVSPNAKQQRHTVPQRREQKALQQPRVSALIS